MLQHLYLPRQSDSERIQEFLKDLQQLSDEELKVREQNAKSQGIFGVHAQGLYLIALHQETKKRFHESDIVIEDNCIISFNKD
ncbi:MAG: hypothetical protein ACR2KB_00780 [Chitinophagaceae bacterium]